MANDLSTVKAINQMHTISLQFHARYLIAGSSGVNKIQATVK
jgi:hypothetical protein